MKRWKLATLVLLVALLLSLAVPMVSASQTYHSVLTQPNTATVHFRGASLAAFDDAALTVPLTSISWGDVDQGLSYQHTIWIKNTGTMPFNNTTFATSLTTSDGIISWNPGQVTGLAAGASAQVTITFQVGGAAPEGALAFTTTEDGDYTK